MTDHFGILNEKSRKEFEVQTCFLKKKIFFLKVETCLCKQRELVSLECVSESPGRLVKTQIADYTHSFWFSRSRMEQENLHF